MDQLTKIIQSEARVKQLRNHMDTLREMAYFSTHKNINADSDPTHANDDSDADPINAIGDVTSEEFKINRGTNTTARMTNTFKESRVQEILKTVEIGPDPHRSITLCRLLPVPGSAQCAEQFRFLGPQESGNPIGQWPGYLLEIGRAHV